MNDDSHSKPTPAATELPLIDLTDLAFVEGEGAIWSLPHGGDLDANVVRVGAGSAIDEHVNDEVDVLVAVWSGAGDLTIAGESITLQPGVMVCVPKGVSRALYAAGSDLLYLSVHRRRDPMGIRSARSAPDVT